MTALLIFLIGLICGYWWGKTVGIALIMTRMQSIFDDLQRIQDSFNQWNEDQL